MYSHLHVKLTHLLKVDDQRQFEEREPSSVDEHLAQAVIVLLSAVKERDWE